MTRYARYKKHYNSKTIEEEKLERLERKQVKASKQQTVEALRNSKPLRSKPVCLRCRKRGHSLKYCPQGRENICYRCGSTDHTLKACLVSSSSIKGQGLPFAKCFICSQTGHLTSTCPQNDRGIYPKGGGCRFCGSKEHLARNCRSTRDGTTKAVVVGQITDPKRDNPEDDLMLATLKDISDERPLPSSKAVEKTKLPNTSHKVDKKSIGRGISKIVKF